MPSSPGLDKHMADPNDPTQGFLDALANFSTYSGNTASNMAKGLVDQTKLNQTQDQLGLNRANTGVNVGTLNLAQQKQALSAPGQLANQSVRGDILANSQDATVSNLPSYIHVPTQTGGLRPSMLSASSRALGGQMSRNALADSTSGKYTTQAPLPTVPSATAMPDPSVLQGLLAKSGMAAGAASTGGGILDALKKLLGGGSGKPGASSTTSGASSPHPTNGNTGMPTGDFTDNLNDPGNPPMPNVDTNTMFTDPYAGVEQQPVDYSWLFNGGGAPPEDPFGMEPSAEWGG